MSPTRKGLVHIPNWKGAGPYPQPERGHCIFPSGNAATNTPYIAFGETHCQPNNLRALLRGCVVLRAMESCGLTHPSCLGGVLTDIDTHSSRSHYMDRGVAGCDGRVELTI